MDKSIIPIFGRTIEAGSEEYFQYNCTDCDKAGQFKEASKYCPICNILYCDKCVSKHGVPNHQIVPVSDWGQSEDISCSWCEDHPVATNYCSEHGLFCCTPCATLHQRKCRNISDIGPQAKDVWHSEEFGAVREAIDRIKSEFQQLKSVKHAAQERLIEKKKDTHKTMKRFFKKIIHKLKELKYEAGHEIDGICDSIKDSLEQDLRVCDAIISDLQLQTMYIESKKATEVKMFIKLKKIQNNITEYDYTKDELSQSSSCVEDVRFTSDKDVLTFVENLQALGKVETLKPITTETQELASGSQNVQARRGSQAHAPEIQQFDTPQQPTEPRSISFDPTTILQNKECIPEKFFSADVTSKLKLQTVPETAKPKIPQQLSRSLSLDQFSEKPELVSRRESTQTSQVSQTHEKGIQQIDTSPEFAEPHSNISSDEMSALTKQDSIHRKSLNACNISELNMQTVTKTSNPKKPQQISRSFSSGQFAEQNMSALPPFPDSVMPPRKVEYNIRLEEDLLQCNIQGMCGLPNGNILISDVRNKKIKLLDNNYKVVDHCDLPAGPRGLCCTGPQEAAVALNNQTIQFFTYGDELQLTHSIQLKHSCYGLTHYKETLYVTKMDGTTVYVYNKAGHRLRDISSVDLAGTKKFASTQHVYITRDGTRIYVADFEKGLVSVDGRGKLLSSLAQPSLRSACGVCTDTSGNVYVSGWKSHNVVKYGNRGTKALGEVVTSSDGVYYPTCILYDSSQSNLIVSNNPAPKGSDILTVFKV